MPIYEYQCEACGHTFDTLQKISEDPLTDCPECGKPALKKLVSAAGFRLKGSGWYETDFKSGGKKNVARDDNKTSGKSDSSSGSSGSGNTSSKKKSGDAS